MRRAALLVLLAALLGRAGAATGPTCSNASFLACKTLTLSTTAPLTGGGDLSSNRTFGISDFVGSGASHARGAVPDPGSSAGTTKFLCENGTWAVPAGAGTVTSVALTAPTQFSVSGSPVTGAGTLGFSWQTQSANTVLAGPTTGAAAAPTFRALVAADVPAIAESGVTNLTSDLAAKAPAARSIATTPPLTGGGDLSADRTLAVSDATTGAKGVVQLAGDLAGTAASPVLATIGSATGPLGTASRTPTVTIDAKGRVTALSDQAIAIGESQVASLTSDLAAKAPSARSIATTAPLTGGGDLSADRTLGITDFVGSGASHARGAVPDPGSSAGSTKFLCENGTWATPPASGSVTSVGMTVPSEFAVSGSPITTSGTFGMTWNSPVTAAHGGTGVNNTPTQGRTLLGNGSGFATSATSPLLGGVDLSAQSGIDCTTTTDSTSGFLSALAAAQGGTLWIRSGCLPIVSGPSAGAALATLNSNTHIVCEDATAGFSLARRTCSGGHVQGAYCVVDADCNPSGSGATCVPEGGASGPFAPSSGSVYTLFKAAASSSGQSIENCSLHLHGYDGYYRCSGGSNDGKTCGSYCSTNFGGVTFACNTTAASCTGLSLGTCNNAADCGGGGGTCTGAMGAQSGPGTIDPIDFSTATNALVSNVKVYDQRTGDYVVNLGTSDKLIGLDDSYNWAATGNYPSSGTGDPWSWLTQTATSYFGTALTSSPAPVITLPKVVVLTGGSNLVRDSTIVGTNDSSTSVGIYSVATTGSDVFHNTVSRYRGTGILLEGLLSHVADNGLLGIGDGIQIGPLVATMSDGNTGAFSEAHDNYIAPAVDTFYTATTCTGPGTPILCCTNAGTGNCVTGRGLVSGCSQQCAYNHNRVSGAFNCAFFDANVQNTELIGNQCYFGNAAKIVISGGAGIRVFDNYLAWSSGISKSCGGSCDEHGQQCFSDADCHNCTSGADKCLSEPDIWIGGIGTNASNTGHIQIGNNIIHDNNGLCASGARVGQGCSLDSTDATYGCGAGATCPGCCKTESLVKFGDSGLRCLATGGRTANYFKKCQVNNCASSALCTNGVCASGPDSGKRCCGDTGGGGAGGGCNATSSATSTLSANELLSSEPNIKGVDLSYDAVPSTNTTLSDLASVGNHFSLTGTTTTGYDLSGGSSLLSGVNLTADSFAPTVANKIVGFTWPMGMLAELGPLDADDEETQTGFLTRDTGATVDTGYCLQPSTGTDNAYNLATAASGNAIGVALDVPSNGSVGKVALSGETTCAVDGVSVSRGDRLKVSPVTPGKFTIADIGEPAGAVALSTGTTSVRCLLGSVPANTDSPTRDHRTWTIQMRDELGATNPTVDVTGIDGNVLTTQCAVGGTQQAPCTGNAASVEDNAGTYIGYSTSTTANLNAGWISSRFTLTDATQNPEVTFVFRTGSNITNVRYWVGLTNGEMLGSVNPNHKYVGLRYDTSNSDSTWMCVDGNAQSNCNGTPTNGGSACTMTAAQSPVPAPTGPTKYTVKIRITSSAGSITGMYWYVNGVLACSKTSNFKIGATDALGFEMGVQNLTTAVREIDVSLLNMEHF